MIDGKNVLINQLKIIKTYDNVLKITTDQGDNYTTGLLLD